MTPLEAARACGRVDSLFDAEFFKAMSDATRLRLLSCLTKCRRPCSVTELTECCSVDFSVVSRHLGILERAGLLTSSKEGRTVFYEVRYRHLSDTFQALARSFDVPERKTKNPGKTRIGRRS